MLLLSCGSEVDPITSNGPNRGPASRLLGALSAASDAVGAITQLAERTHQRGARRVYEQIETVTQQAGLDPARDLVAGVATIHEATATLSFGVVRGVNAALGGLVDLAAQAVAALPSGSAQAAIAGDTTEPTEGKSRWPAWIDQAEGAVNGFFGDHLAARKNPLAIGMALRHEGRELPLEPGALRALHDPPRRRVCLFVHGLSATEYCWWIGAERFYGDASTSFGTLLATELDVQPYYVRYNSGHSIEDSGRSLAALIDALDRAHPVAIDEWNLVGHSMGGLVLRYATLEGARQNAPWVQRLGHVFCLGSPHQGSVLEQSAELARSVLSRIDLAATQVPAAVIGARSVGIKDLHDGVGALPLLDHVHYTFLGATLAKDAAHPLGRLFGDLLVLVPSATDAQPVPIARPFVSTRVFPGMAHLTLCSHPDVYALLRETLSPSTTSAQAPSAQHAEADL